MRRGRWFDGSKHLRKRLFQQRRVQRARWHPFNTFQYLSIVSQIYYGKEGDFTFILLDSLLLSPPSNP